MKLTVTNTSPLPLYRQMYDQLAAQILRGEIAPGEVLPPIRTVTAPSFSYRRLRISLGLPMCAPCKNTFSCSGSTSPRR